LTMAAPSASVEDPPKAAMTRLASRPSKLVDTADPMIEQNIISDAMTNTGRLPKYSAVGTQKKFYAISSVKRNTKRAFR
jgi:hypothetical protein